MKTIDKYTNKFSINKTLRFKLIPVNETLENIKKNGFLEKDNDRKEQYSRAKKVLDNVHKAYIEYSLSDYKDDWTDLYSVYFSSQNGNKSFEDKCKLYQNRIAVHLKNKGINQTKIANIIKSKKLSFYILSNEELEILESFKGFTTYFTNYEEARNNIYKCDIKNSIPYRIVNENFVRFINNIKQFEKLSDEIKNKISEQMKESFVLSSYNKYITQKGIDEYNAIIGGISKDERIKIKGINEIINEEYQKGNCSKVLFKPLYKQILSDSESLSFSFEQIESDNEIKELILNYSSKLEETMNECNKQLFEMVDNNQVDLSKIYYDTKRITDLSQFVCGDWSTIKNVISLKKDEKIVSVEKVDNSINKLSLSILFNGYKNNCTMLDESKNKMVKYINENERLTNFDQIKDYLDKVQECEHNLKTIISDVNDDKDETFYSAFDKLYDSLNNNVHVYNAVRNYATKKPYKDDKYKLNFDCPTLANGWDKNKEKSNLCTILMKDDNYFLAIYNPKLKKKEYLDELAEDNGNCYKKMVYKLLPGSSKMLPKVFIKCKSWIKEHHPSEYIIDGYNKGNHLKDNLDINYLHELIDYYKDCITKYDKWSAYDFNFSDTKSYNYINEFYAEVDEQAYKISYSYIAECRINEMIKNNSLFLFQIYNKDFSEYSKGNSNMHTLYWKELFSDANKDNPIFKLSGGAELFYRPKSIDNPFIHNKGSILVSKNDANGIHVNEDAYNNAVYDANEGLPIETLKDKYPNLVFKKAEYDIVKDRRYSQDHFEFHVPIVINNTCSNKENFNKTIVKDLINDKSINIIGIDRGERNLLYVSCIDQNGNILEQKSLNIINGCDYHAKLDVLEKENLKARKNWKSINKIKDMKAGYLSYAIKEIAEMMVKYNAIVVLEDLNMGFKNTRMKVEKNVYQKFEKMLIDKLNYYVQKNNNIAEIGGVRKGYQLTDKFETFSKLGSQSGWLFYVPAAYTSKIDPITGFVNLFTSKELKYSSIEKTKEFISKFKNIYFDDSKQSFAFEFKYSDFNLNKRDYIDEWTIYSFGRDRIVHTKENGYDIKTKLDVTEKMKELFSEYKIDYKSTNLVEELLSVNSSSFYKTFLWLFSSIVQLRYEDENDDFIISPTCKDGIFFDSRIIKQNLPVDGDANGAYHIALQGLRIIKERLDDKTLKIKNDKKGEQLYNWLKFVQDKNAWKIK